MYAVDATHALNTSQRPTTFPMYVLETDSRLGTELQLRVH
jgi:hypothetical protein